METTEGGDIMPRPFMVGNAIYKSTPDPLFEQGYAIVAVIREWQGYNLALTNYIGER